MGKIIGIDLGTTYVPVAEIEKLENQHFDEITKAGYDLLPATGEKYAVQPGQ